MKRALEAMSSWAHSQQPKSQRPKHRGTDARRRKISQQMVDHIARQTASSIQNINFIRMQNLSDLYFIRFCSYTEKYW